MAISQARIIESMEQACSNPNPDEFIFTFLDAYGFPKSTITRLRKGDDSRNVASGNDIGLKKKLYFRSVPEGADLNVEADSLKESEVVSRNDIRFVIVTDFKSLVAFDLKAEERLETTMDELDKQYAFFLPLAGYEKAVMYSEHPADVKASEKMGRLFDLIRERNDLSKPEDIHALNVFLTRLLFCFYAEDTGIFAQGQMTSAIQSTTQEDGSDVDQFFSDLFTVLNLNDKAPERASMAAHFQEFPYVNGGLFEADEPIPEFGRKARRLLIDCGNMDWSEINPDIFGSMFQAVIDEEQRGSLGQHYTSVSNIMKVIQPLFLDKLYTELEKSRNNERKLKEMLLRLQNLRIFDPACGSGNFLIIAYKELRKLEMEVIDVLNAASGQAEMYYSGIRLSQFYGIEIDDFAHEVAILSLWLAEHQMNTAFKAKFGYAEAALPLRDSGNIYCGNALRLEWTDVCSLADPNGNPREVYICGNPPFQGAKRQSSQQKYDMSLVFKNSNTYKNLDYVSCWFMLASNYMRSSSTINAAFVATSSIIRGDQVGLLWDHIGLNSIYINFAYVPFKWTNNARQNAGVSCVIIGICSVNPHECLLYTESHLVKASAISPYLTDSNPVIVYKRKKSLSGLPEMIYGNMPLEGGFLKLDKNEVDSLLKSAPSAEKFIVKLIGGNEFLKGEQRWALWIEDNDLGEALSFSDIALRVQQVREFRSKGGDVAKTLVNKSHQFRYRHRSKEHSFIIPCTFSEGRDYLQLGYFDKSYVTLNSSQVLMDAPLYIFSLLSSRMHMIWTKATAGTLESRIRYSSLICYNTFPIPELDDCIKDNLSDLSEELIVAREGYPELSIADMYNPKKMPSEVKNIHLKIDALVEGLYKSKPFVDDSERLSTLFSLYEQMIAEDQARAPAKKTAEGSN